ncbi:MAG TPA: SDR family oxidoreductase [Pseudonocardia sp.]|nr:SDR family oxidoreductase [Pseudonocardia sp.]
MPPLAAELAPLRVNAVSPGVVRTPWWDGLPTEQRDGLFADIAAATPVGRVGEPAEVADVIRLLVTNGFLTGIVIPCTGGVTLPSGALRL